MQVLWFGGVVAVAIDDHDAIADVGWSRDATGRNAIVKPERRFYSMAALRHGEIEGWLNFRGSTASSARSNPADMH
jgi:hypothetical protein